MLPFPFLRLNCCCFTVHFISWNEVAAIHLSSVFFSIFGIFYSLESLSPMIFGFPWLAPFEWKLPSNISYRGSEWLGGCTRWESQDLSGALQQRSSRDVWSSKTLHQPGAQNRSLQWKPNLSFAFHIFCPCFGFVFFSFLPLELSRQHLGVLWNKCYPLKAHHCLPERKMASYWKQYVMVIAVLLQVMPLKNIRDLFSSNWWWGKAQLNRKLTVVLSFTQL